MWRREGLIITLAVLLIAGSVQAATVVNVDDSQQYQEMDGFGGSFTDSAAWMIYESGVLNSTQINNVMDELFDPAIGIGLSYLRQPIGTSDFRWEDYTYNDLPQGQTDYSLTNFSIARDLSYIVPAVKQAMAINGDLKVMACPWSPPAWMKDSESLYNGQLIDSDQIYDTYADYFVKFVQAYGQEGIAIDAIALQNEPGLEPGSYPGLKMNEADQIRLAIKVGQKFQQNNISSKIIAYDHNWDNPSFPINVLNDATARSYIDGSAFHCYGGSVSAQTQVHDAHPDKNIYFTECTASGTPSFVNDFKWCLQNLVIGSTRNWAKTVCEWNIALGNYHGPKIAGGCETCNGLVTVVWETGEIIKSPEYYAIGHASKFVTPGAFRIDTDHVDTVAFINPDNSIVMIALNTYSHGTQTFEVNWQGKNFTYDVPEDNAVTFTWPNTANPTVSVWQTNFSDQSKLLEQQPDVSFDTGGGACNNNGTCEAGEDCSNCPSDCISRTSGKPSSQYCCGDGTCEGAEDSSNCAVDCGGSSSYCGDGTCDPGEDECSCSDDCGTPTTSEANCSDGADEDCDGFTDCDDSDCSSDPVCFDPCDNDGTCEPGEDCNNCSGDCAGRTGGRPASRYCCGNGLVEDPEGDGSVCDGNY